MFERFDPKHLYLKYSKKIKNFLLNVKSREFLVFLFFVLIAAGFWLLQTLDNEYEAEMSIPIRMKDVPDDVIITSQPISEVQVRVKDRGSVLFNYLLRGKSTPIDIEFEDGYSKDNHIKIRTTDIERKIHNQLNVSTRLLSASPDTIDYIYSTGKAKLLPVKLTGDVLAARQYYIADTIISPDSVMVYAPNSILDTLVFAYTKRLDLSDISDTLKCRIEIAKIRGAKFVPDAVDCIFSTDIYTEKTVEVPVIGINFPTDKVLRTFPSRVQVTFRVGMGQFKQITSDDFLIVVPYESLLKNHSDKCVVRLQSIPSGISQIRIVPEQVDFLIEQNSVLTDEH